MLQSLQIVFIVTGLSIGLGAHCKMKMTSLIILVKYQFIPKRIKCPFYVFQREVHESLWTSNTAFNTLSSFLYPVSL